MTDQTYQILLVEDNADDAFLIGDMLGEQTGLRFDMVHAESLGAARSRLAETRFDAVLLDLFLGDGQGLQVVLQVKEVASATPVLVLTGLEDEEMAVEALRLGAQDYLVKGRLSAEMIGRVLHYAVERQHQENRNRALDVVRARIWSLAPGAGVEGLLEAFREGLDNLGLPFRFCGLNIIDAEQGMARAYNAPREGAWLPVHSEEASVIEAFRAGRAPVYRPDLSAEDTYGERAATEELFGAAVRSVLDVPYSRGTIAISSSEPHAFSGQDITTLEQFARVLDDGFRRLDDLGQLARSEARYRTLVETPNIGLLLLDRQGGVLYINPYVEQLVGHGADAFDGSRTIWDFVVAEDRESGREMVSRALRGHISPERELRILRSGDELRYASVSVFPVYGEPDEVESVQVVVQDITDIKWAQDFLDQARRDAEAASRMKSEFLANMSHELRTPMNAILGMASLLDDTRLTSTQREYLEAIEVSADGLLHLIESILDLSKIEAGKLALERTPFSLEANLDNSMKVMAFKAHDKGLELTYGIAPEVPESLVGDGARLRQIILNLLANAIKFTAAGTVALQVEVAEQGAEQATLHFSVRDTGIGIPPDKLELVFETFAQVDSSATREYGGTGLGLSISKQLAEMMGGRIWAESVEGRGSTFHFTARFGIRAEQPAKPDAAALAGLRVLVVDDNGTNRRILGELLGRWGMRPTLVPSGESALAMLQTAGSGRVFDIVLLDVMMPAMDGFAVAQKIVGEADAPVVVMLSSLDDQDYIAKCHALGVAAFRRKPISPSDLIAALVNAVDPDAPAEQAPVLRQSQGRRGLRILLTEDNTYNQRMATALLERREHEVALAENGREALDALEETRFDLVLMDVQMPEMDGLEATAAIREREAQSGGRMPIIGLTAHASLEDREKCLVAGMDYFLTKPVRAEALYAAIDEVLGPGVDQVPEETTAVGEGAPPGQVLDEVLLAQGEIINRARILSFLDNDTDLLAQMVELFFIDYPPRLDRVKTAIETQDGDALFQASHDLKGLVATWHLESLKALMIQLERSGKAQDFERAESQYQALARRLEEIAPELRALVS